MLVDLIKRLQPTPKSTRWEDYFHGDEELLWSASPVRTLNWTWGMVGMSLFGLPFLFAGLGTFSFGILALFDDSEHASLIGAIGLTAFSLPFMAVGIGLTIGTWVMASLSPHFVRYALTNKRAYIATAWWQHKMESYPIAADNYTALEHGKGDTVYFAKMTERDSDGDKTTSRIGFENIANGDAVYALLRDLQQKAKT